MGDPADKIDTEAATRPPSPNPKWLVASTKTDPGIIHIINKGLAILPRRKEDEPFDHWMDRIDSITINPTWTFNTLTLGGRLLVQLINISHSFERQHDKLTPSKKEQLEKKFYDLYATYSLIASKDVHDKFYNQACNVFWALFHRDIEKNGSITDIYAVKTPELLTTWRDYVAMNEAYAERYVQLVLENKVNVKIPIWIHDYQLMLAPDLIRKKLMAKEIEPPPIGFFLHIPVPTVAAFLEELNRLKTSEEKTQYTEIIKDLVKGMLGADMAGFQTDEYRDNFMSLAKHFKFKIDDKTKEVVLADGRISKISTHPIGINYEKYTIAKKTEAVKKITDFQGRGGQLILAIERADPAKGLPAKLMAFKYYLKNLAAEHGGSLSKLDIKNLASFLVIAVPTRSVQPEYIAERQLIDELVNSINHDFGTPAKDGTWIWKPVHCVHERINSPEEMAAIYQEADVNVVTPKRDGMNLSAKECIAASHAAMTDTKAVLPTATSTTSSSKIERPVVMILSDRMGAAKQLGDKGAITISPVVPDSKDLKACFIDNLKGLATAFKDALDMPIDKRKARLASLAKSVESQDAKWWIGRFETDLRMAYERNIKTKVTTATPPMTVVRNLFFSGLPTTTADKPATAVPAGGVGKP